MTGEETKAMTDQEIQELRDLQGFIEFCIQKNERQGYCLANVGHDCGQLLLRNSGNQDGSTPRTAGFAEHLSIWEG